MIQVAVLTVIAVAAMIVTMIKIDMIDYLSTREEQWGNRKKRKNKKIFKISRMPSKINDSEFLMKKPIYIYNYFT